MFEFILIGYPVFGLAIGALYVSLLRRRAARYAMGLLALYVVWAVVLAFVTVYRFGGGFGLGSLLLCLSFLSTLMLAAAFAIWRRKTWLLLADDRRLRRLCGIGALVILIGQLAPFVGVYGIAEGCDAWNAQRAWPIAEAMNAYRVANGEYPADLDALVPDYLDALPAPACFQPFDWPIFGSRSSSRAQYAIETCRTGETLITWRGLTGVTIERINLTTGNSGGVSFFDGACSYLP